MKTYILAFKILILVFAISCSSKSTQNGVVKSTEESKSSEISEKLDYKELAKSKYGEKVSFQMNESETHVICSKRFTENNVNYLKLFVFDNSTNKIVYEPNDRFRKVSWRSDDEIEAYKIIGMPNADNPEGKLIYNVITNKEITPKSN